MKRLVCRCEDVTEQEVIDAIERGYTDMESLKKYLGIGTGPCQGKNCLAKLASILSARGLAVKHPTTSRIPIFPLPLGMLTGEGSSDGR